MMVGGREGEGGRERDVNNVQRFEVNEDPLVVHDIAEAPSGGVEVHLKGICCLRCLPVRCVLPPFLATTKTARGNDKL